MIKKRNKGRRPSEKNKSEKTVVDPTPPTSARKPPSVTTDPWWRNLGSAGKRVVLGIGTGIALLSGVLGIMSFVLPNLSVAPSTVLDPARPLSTQFAVTNNGFIPLTDVTFSFALGSMTKPNGGRMDTYDPATLISSSTLSDRAPVFTSAENLRPRLIEPQHSETIDNDFAGLKDVPLAYADIGIFVSYRVWFLPWKHKRLYRFETQKMADGTLAWAPKVVVQ